MSVLGKTKTFANLEPEALQHIEGLLEWESYRNNQHIILHKDFDTGVYILSKGKVRVTIYSSNGQEVAFRELEPGATFGELSAIDQLPRTANVITLEDSHIGMITSKAFWQLVEKYPGFAQAVMERLAGMVRFLADRVYQFGALDVKDRVRVEVVLSKVP